MSCNKLYLIYNSGAVAVTSEYYGENSRPMSVKEVECNGSELTLLDCNLESNSQNPCGLLQDSGIVCQGKQNLNKINIVLLHLLLSIVHRYIYSL